MNCFRVFLRLIAYALVLCTSAWVRGEEPDWSLATTELEELLDVSIGCTGNQCTILVDLVHSDAADAAIKLMKKRPVLQSCVLQLTNANDEDLQRLEGLTELRALDLSVLPITDAGLRHLRGLTNLRSLDLSSTKVTDRGLEHLKGMTQLTSLGLGGTLVTDAALKYLGSGNQ